MAEGNEAEKQQAPAGDTSSGQKPTLFIILAIVNMAAILGVVAMLYMGQKKADKEPGLDKVIKGEHEAQKKDDLDKEFIGKLIPLETFLVNLSRSHGRKLAKVNMELEVEGEGILEEIDKLKPKIRDIIIIIISSKAYAQVSTKDGKDKLRTEIRDQVNLFLTKGQIKRVYFTEFLYN